MNRRKRLGVLILLLQLVTASSEENEGRENVCATTEFKCGGDQVHCIPESWLCDSEEDCEDGSDEHECPGERLGCGKDEFLCGDQRCIPVSWQCDGSLDCSDGLDEWKENCDKRRCMDGEFLCPGTGKCIPGAYVCDGKHDCADQMDEHNCNERCDIGEFRCADSECIQAKWKCDKSRDCDDGSDEWNCTAPVCSSAEFTCTNGACIANSWRCDGFQDCTDGSDEKDCSRKPEDDEGCKAEEFECKDGKQCIHRQWVCDLDFDCHDQSDESEEVCGVRNLCREDQFRCGDGMCIPEEFRCSSQPECMDGSDEHDCEFEGREVLCDDTEFTCNISKKCIPRDRVCDGYNDCVSNEDESRDLCHGRGCDVDNGGCDQECVRTVQGHYCACRKGYTMGGNKTCTDIDECETKGACSHFCENREGGHVCSCLPGYIPSEEDATRCLAQPEKGRLALLYTHKRDIRLTDLRRRETAPVVEGTRSAVGIDFHYAAGQIFWTDSVEKRIYRARMEDEFETKKVVIDKGAEVGLAVDWIHNNLYWIRKEEEKKYISLADFNGNNVVDLVSEDVHNPQSIALHPSKGWMFWSDWGKIPKIEKCGMDGTRREILVKDNMLWPNGMALDLVTETLYWVDAKLHTVNSVGILEGGTPRQVLHSPLYLYHPYGISVFEDFIYWTDWGLNSTSIFKADKFNGNNILEFKKITMDTPMSVKVYHSYIQPGGENQCLRRETRCSHLCVPVPSSAVTSHPTNHTGHTSDTNHTTSRQVLSSCLCPRGWNLAEDGATCATKSGVAVKRIEPKAEAPTAAAASEDSTLFYGLVVGGTAIISILLTLVSFILYKRLLGQREKGAEQNVQRNRYQAPVRASLAKFHESESMVPLKQRSPESEVESA